MTMKFRVDDKEHGYAMKKEILSWRDALTRASVWNIKDLLDDDTISRADKDYSWDLDSLKNNRKIRVRYGKRDEAWYLYLPDPEYTPYEEPSDPILDDETMAFLDRLTELAIRVQTEVNDHRRKVMIRRKKKEYPGWFLYARAVIIRPATASTPEVVDDWFMCEFQDGHCERIKYDHVRFVNEWEEE